MYIKKLSAGLAVIMIFLFAISCNGKTKRGDKIVVSAEISVMEVSIGGMSCTGCEQTIQQNVGKLDGIKSVKASYTTGKAIIEYFPEKVDSIKIKESISGSGYSVKKIQSSKQ